MNIGKGPYFEEIDVGTELPALFKEASVEQFAMYAAACWDFRSEHYDSGTAQSYGFRAAYADGPMITAFLGQVVTNWMGVSGRLRKLTATYRVMVFPGDKLACRGKITGKYTREGSNLVECEVWAENQNAERAVYGTAIVELPNKPVSA